MVANMSDEAVETSLSEAFDGSSLLGKAEISGSRIELGPYGFEWFLLEKP